MIVTHVKHGVQYAFEDNPETNEFTKIAFPSWEPGTFEMFDWVKNSSKTAIDIGAWIGTTSVWLSKNFNRVVSVEADKRSIYFLNRTIELSDCTNVTICPHPIYSSREKRVFGGINGTLNTSMSQIKDASDHPSDYTMETLTFDDILATTNTRIEDVSFIKCDIEGGEEYILESLLDTADKHGIDVYMSFHVGFWKHHVPESFTTLFAKWAGRIYAAPNVRENSISTSLHGFPSFLFKGSK